MHKAEHNASPKAQGVVLLCVFLHSAAGLAAAAAQRDVPDSAVLQNFLGTLMHWASGLIPSTNMCLWSEHPSPNHV